MIGSLLQDLRYAARRLLRAPGFAAVAVATLGLGIGANTTVFSMVNAVLVRPLPFQDPGRLVVIEGTHSTRPGEGLSISYPDYLDIRESVSSLQNVAVWDWQPFNLRGPDEAAFVGGMRVTASFFPTLGLEPILGRGFTPDDDRPGASPVVLLGEELWRSRFASDPDVVGSVVRLDGTPHTVLGVMPAGVGFLERTRLWVPLATSAEQNPRGNRWLSSVARLAPGATVAAAEGELEALAGWLAEAYPATNGESGLRANDLRADLLGEGLASLFLLLLGAVGVLLLIACANLANLLLARAAHRERELAVRAALGAGRRRLLRQLLAESLLLGTLGAALGWVLGQAGVELALRWIPTEVPAWIRLEPDLRMLGFVTGVSLLAVLLFGLGPALLASRRDPRAALLGSAGRAGGPGRGRLRSGLVVTEVALSVTLLIGAGLVLRSLLALAAVDPGFDPEGRLVASTALAPALYPGDEERRTFYRDLLRELEATPGVRGAGVVSRLPLRGSSDRNSWTAEGQGEEEHRANPFVLVNSASPGYFRAAGIALLRGRGLTAADDADAPRVAVVNRTLADRYWPDDGAVGRRLKFGSPGGTGEWIRIVGVVEDVRHSGIDREPSIQLYRPYPQRPTSRLGVVLHAGADPEALRPALAQAIEAVDPDQALYDVMTAEAVVREAGWEWRFFSGLFWVFGGLAAFLATLGLYGVLAYLVAGRRREFGIRLALGAGPAAVMRGVLRDGARLFAVGALLGTLAGLLLNRAMAALLYEVDPVDLPTFVAALGLLGAAAAGATWLPARRAMRVDPARTLRTE